MANEKIYLVVLKMIEIVDWFGQKDIHYQKAMVKYVTTDKAKADEFRNKMDLSDIVSDDEMHTIKKYAKIISLPQDIEIDDYIYGLV